MKTVIYTEKAPKPIGPYSQAVCVNGWLYVSGQIPIDPATGGLIEGSFKDQVRRALENAKAILETSGGGLESVVKVTVYLKDMSKFQEFNEVYSEYFKQAPPARSVVGVSSLPRNAELMIDLVAYLGHCKS